MDDNSPVQSQDESEIESLKKTTRISLDDALIAKSASKTTTSLTDQVGEKKATGPIMGIPTHTAPIPQTIRLKRPSTSPIVINPPGITTAPTVAKIAHPKSPTSPAGETPTVIKRAIPPRPLQETSRIILEPSLQAADVRQKTGPIPGISLTEPTPGPKTIRLKRPSTIVAVDQPEAKQALSSDMQAAKKSETAKIELPKDAEYLTSATQRKTIKIKRTDRNIISRTANVARQTPAELGQAEAKPQAEAAAPKEEQVPKAPILDDEPLPAFAILAGLAAVCLVLLVYLLAAQSFGPDLVLPVPAGLL
ncbi:MAG: hypothetical protein Q7J98_05485 [Kiritimatiellia bacterium]|nr:hypothetical protein [Kiritimatiellia bacterium]